MKQPYIETPLIRSAYLSDHCGLNVHLKLENTQPSGSFKTRGLGVLIKQAVEAQPDVHVYSSSGGNAGLAAATAAQLYKVQCTVVVPTLTKQVMIDRIKKLNAEVIVHGNQWSEADNYMKELMEKHTGPTLYCHPFDHPVIWKGHSSMIDEIKDQLNGTRPDGVIVACGGGGLFTGVAQGLDKQGWSDVPIVAVGTEGACALATSVKAKKKVVLDKIDSVATSLGASYVTDEAFNIGMQPRTKCAVVTDKEATDSLVKFADDHKFVVEPACGAALSICYFNKLRDLVPNLNKDSNIVVVVCGGTSTSLDMLDGFRN